MKRLFIMLALVGSAIFTTSYAAGTNNSPVVKHSFEASFTGAKEIVWEQIGFLYKATFELNGQYRSAFYNNDGELVAITRNIKTTELPKALQNSLKKELNGTWITDLFVVTIEGDDTFYVNLENADTTVMLQSTGSKKWSIYQKKTK